VLKLVVSIFMSYLMKKKGILACEVSGENETNFRSTDLDPRLEFLDTLQNT
jgi:hypothetical protein